MTTTQDPTIRQTPRPRRGGVLTGIRSALAILGALALVAIAVGTTVDIANIDPTSGGYEPPFSDYIFFTF